MTSSGEKPWKRPLGESGATIAKPGVGAAFAVIDLQRICAWRSASPYRLSHPP